MIGYACGWLRYYYPTEFITAYLNNANNDDDITNGTMLANQLNIKIMPIKFRHSIAKYSCDGATNTIYKGLASIKFLNEQIGDELYTLRDNHYDTFIDLLVDIDNTSINSRQLDILTKLNFFSEFGEVNQLLAIEEVFSTFYGKKQIKKDKLTEAQIEAFKMANMPESNTMFKPESMVDAIKVICEHIDYPATTIQDLIKYEQEHLGFISLTDETASKRDYVVTKIEEKKTLTIITLYGLRNGKTEEVKIWANRLARYPIEEGDILEIHELSKKHKQKWDGTLKENGKRNYVDVPNEYEFWLEAYKTK